MTSTEASELLGIGAAARFAGVSDDTFRRWWQRKLNGIPEPVDLPGYPRWRRKDLLNWIASLKKRGERK